MPDLKTALSEAISRRQEEQAVLAKTLEEWEDHEQQIRNHKTEAPQPQQENTMPRTGAHTGNTYSITNNVMRTTYNYIRDHAGVTRKDVVAALTKQGYKESSVTAVVSQLTRTKQVHKNFDSGLHARNPEYTPITQKKRKPAHPKAQISKELSDKIQARRKIVVMKRKKPEPASDGIAALKAGTSVGELLRQKLDPELWKPEKVVNNLNVVQARQLYDYLRNVFGG